MSPRGRLHAAGMDNQPGAPDTHKHKAHTMTHDDDKAGFHRFGEGAEEYGSFEVYYLSAENSPLDSSGERAGAGWYWHACFPGCFPDAEPFGPFPSGDDAFEDAQGANF